MKAVADNDILLKGACYGLLPRLAATVPGDGQVGILGNAGIDDGLLEGYQQRKLDRVAQTVVTSIAAVERIDSAAPFDVE